MTNLDVKIRPISDILAPEEPPLNLREPTHVDPHAIAMEMADDAAGRSGVADIAFDRLVADLEGNGIPVQRLKPAVPVSRLPEAIDRLSAEYVDAMHEHDGGGEA